MAYPVKDSIKPFKDKMWLASPTMHGEELKYIQEAFDANWISTLGANIEGAERAVEPRIGVAHAVALSSGTAALHLALRLAGHKLYGRPAMGRGALEGRRVFASDMTFDATVNPIAYEGGEAVLIDSERGTWNMCPEALERAFELYPDVKVVVMAHLYGTPAMSAQIKRVCRAHGAILIEDAAESLGARYFDGEAWRETGSLGDIGCISFNGNKIVTGSSGGMLLTESAGDAELVRKWSTQAREKAPWYQHEELGFNYRMSNIIAGIVRGQLLHLDEHIELKRTVFERYREGLRGLPLKMAPYDAERSTPNFWLSCIILDEDAMCPQERGRCEASFTPVHGKSCPTEILKVLADHNAEGRPIWKPMHMQPLYAGNGFVSINGDVGADVFRRGLCLPSDIKMTAEQQNTVIELIRRCFD